MQYHPTILHLWFTLNLFSKFNILVKYNETRPQYRIPLIHIYTYKNCYSSSCYSIIWIFFSKN